MFFGRMEYIEMVVSESLRLTPVAAMVDRLCTKDYRLPCGNVVKKDSR